MPGVLVVAPPRGSWLRERCERDSGTSADPAGSSGKRRRRARGHARPNTGGVDGRLGLYRRTTASCAGTSSTSDEGDAAKGEKQISAAAKAVVVDIFEGRSWCS